MTAASAAMVGTLTSGSRGRWLAWSSVVLYAALAGVSIALETRFVGRIGLPDLWLALVVLGYAVIGALIVNTHRSHVIGWMFCGAALSFGFSSFAGQYAIQALVVAPGDLRPRGYERFHHRSSGGLWREGHDLLQVFEARVPGTRPALAAELDDTSDRRWATWAELERTCSGQFWWPLADAVLRPPGG